MQTYILTENVLSDNILLMPEYGQIFKGGYIAVIKEYTFQNEWSDKETIKRFSKKETLDKYLNKYYPNINVIFN
jgi:hypothetical protein